MLTSAKVWGQGLYELDVQIQEMDHPQQNAEPFDPLRKIKLRFVIKNVSAIFNLFLLMPT